ncbi:MAG: hypothetical protein Q7J57_14810, partial [Gemmobacter sp.]|nr:hypothetical protein [Gemmobacter sp.]
MTGQDDDAQDKATPEFEAAAAKPKRSRAKRTKDQPPVPVADVSEPVDGDNLVSQPGPQDPAPSDPAPDTRLPDAWAEEIYPQDLMALDTVAPEWATQDNAAPTDDVTDWTDDTPGAGRYDTLGGLDAADPMDDAALQYEFNPEATESDDTAFTPDLGDANDPGIRTDPPYDPDFAPYGSAEVEQNDPSSGDAAYTLASSDETQATQAYDDATEPAADGIEPAAQVPPAPASGGRSIIALLLGGVLAAGVGFVAARYVQPQGWPFPGSTEQLNAFDQRLSVQEQTIADLRAAPAQTDDRIDTALADLADLATVNGALTEKLDALGNRLAELEARPQPDAAPDTSATELLTTEIE